MLRYCEPPQHMVTTCGALPQFLGMMRVVRGNWQSRLALHPQHRIEIVGKAQSNSPTFTRGIQVMSGSGDGGQNSKFRQARHGGES